MNSWRNVAAVLFLLSFFILNIPFIKAITSFFWGIFFLSTIAGSLLYYFYKQNLHFSFLVKVLGATLLFNSAFILGWFQSPWPLPALQHREFCIQYITEGTLYGGQPYCAQGPITYIVAKGIDLFPGDNMITFQIGSLFMLVGIFILLYTIKKKKTGDSGFFFLTLVFIFYFMRIAEDDFAAVVALFFLLFGIYFLFVSSRQAKELTGTLLLGFAMFSKAQFLVPVFSTLFFYAFFVVYKKEELSLLFWNTSWSNSWKNYISLENVRLFMKKILVLFLPLIVLLLILKIFFPNFISYYYLAQFQQENRILFGEALRTIITFEYNQNGLFLLFYLMLTVAFIRIFIRNSIDLYSWMCSIPLFFVFTKMVQVYGATNITEAYRYFFVFIPFFVVNLSFLKDDLVRQKIPQKIIVLIIISLFFLAFYRAAGGITTADFLDRTVFHEQELIKKIQREILFPIFEISLVEKGKILVSEDYISLFGAKKTNPFVSLQADDFENIIPEDPFQTTRPDMAYVTILEDMGIVNLSEYNPLVEVNIGAIEESLFNGAYPILIQSPYNDILTQLILLYPEKVSQQYTCRVSVGTMIIGYRTEEVYRVLVYFQNQKQCEDFRAKVFTYYMNYYDALCHRGAYIAQIIEAVSEANNMPLVGKACNTWNRTTYFLVPDHFKALYFVFSVLCYLLFVFSLFSVKRYSGRN